MSVFETYLELQESRRPDRAFVWFISLAEQTGKTRRQLEQSFHLRRGEDKMRKGDLLYFEIQAGITKYIYDGSHVCELSSGHVPAKFQVITEYPIYYWRDRLDNWVPFDFQANVIGDGEPLSIDEIKDRDGIPFFELWMDDDTLYIFTSLTQMTRNEFHSRLCRSTYFHYSVDPRTLYLN